jgi:hypothetical protein
VVESMVRGDRARRQRRVATRAIVNALLLASWPLPSCGYHPVYATPPRERLGVKLMRTLLPDAVASEEVAAGAREELSRLGVLAAADAYPRLEIEVLGADEQSQGIQASAAGPVSRATDVGVVARGWIARAPQAEPEADTGDMREEDVLAVDMEGSAPDPRGNFFHRADALRAAARRLGTRIARKIAGAGP